MTRHGTILSVAGLGALTLWAMAGGASAADWPQWGGSPGRNMAASVRGLPDTFQPGHAATDTKPEVLPERIKWTARLGTQTYGNPTVSGGRVFVGTNNGAPRNPKLGGDRAVLMCFRESDGKFLWQLAAPKRKNSGTFNGDYGGLGMCSSPTVDGDRVYAVTSRCEVICLDVRGLGKTLVPGYQGESQYLAKPATEKITEVAGGPQIEFLPGEPVPLTPTDANIVWMFDMMKEVRSWPQDASSCSILIVGDYLYVGTSNGVDSTHKHIPSPTAPSLIVLDKRTGKLVATDDAGIGPRVFHGQWSSPSLGMVNGRTLIFYGGGDGFCYAFDPKPTPGANGAPGVLHEVWRFDCCPPEYRTANGKKIGYASKGRGPSEIIGTPVFDKGRVYVAVGQDPRHGLGKGCLSCIDPTKTGDISQTGLIWQYKDIGRSLSTPSVTDGLVYCPDLGGTLHCVDAATGKAVWTHDVESQVWSSTFVADDKVYLGTERGEMWVLKAGRQKQVLAQIPMYDAVYTTPIVANGVLYVTSQKWLYAVK